MAGVYRKRGTRNWYCTYVGPDGRKVHRSTRMPNRKEALRRAVGWEEDADREREALDAVQRDLLKEIRRAVDLACRGELGLEEGREVVSRLVEVSTGERMRFFTCREWLEEWLGERKGAVKESTWSSYQSVVRRFLSHLGERADRGIEFLRAEELRQYRESLRQGGRKGKTCNMHLKTIRMALAEAVRRGLARRNVAEGIPPLRENDSVQREPLSDGEVKSLLGHASDDWQGMILLGFFAGMRLRDAADLKWENVDLAAGSLSFIPKKTEASARIVLVPLHSQLREWLEERMTDQTGGFVFSRLAGREAGGGGGLSVEFGELMVEAGIERGIVDAQPGAGHGKGSKSFHSLRHSYVSLLAASGVSEEVRMKLAGHTTADVHRSYTHHEVGSLKDAVEMLPKI